MINDNMTDEELAIKDRLDFYMQEKLEVHLTLKRLMKDGKNVWLNGFLILNPTERLWFIKDRVLGEVKVSIAEIKFVEEAK